VREPRDIRPSEKWLGFTKKYRGLNPSPENAFELITLDESLGLRQGTIRTSGRI